MQKKFDELVESILNEVSQPFQGWDGYAQRGMVGREQATAAYNPPIPSRGRERDEPRTQPHYQVYCSDACRNWYKNAVESGKIPATKDTNTIIKYGWRTFFGKNGRQYADEFAKKWKLDSDSVKFVAG